MSKQSKIFMCDLVQGKLKKTHVYLNIFKILELVYLIYDVNAASCNIKYYTIVYLYLLWKVLKFC